MSGPHDTQDDVARCSGPAFWSDPVPVTRVEPLERRTHRRA